MGNRSKLKKKSDEGGEKGGGLPETKVVYPITKIIKYNSGER